MAFCVERNRGQATEACTREVWESLWRDARKEQDVATVRHNQALAATAESQGLDATGYAKTANLTKSGLPGFVFQAREFTPSEWIDKKGVNHGVNTWRKKDYAVLNGLVMVDIDHVDDPRGLHARLSEAKDGAGELLYEKYGVVLVYVTPSGHGLKIVYKARVGIGNLAANQQAFSSEAGVECDPKCKDASRLSFISGRQDVLWLKDELFSYDDAAYREKFTPQYNKTVREPRLPLQGDTKKAAQAAGVTPAAPDAATAEKLEGYRYEGHRLQEYIDAYVEIAAPAVGTRHDTLLHLTAELRNICDRNRELVKHHVMKCQFVKDLKADGDDVERTIDDGLNYKYVPYLSKTMQKAVDVVTKNLATERVEFNQELLERYRQWGEQFRKLFKYFPCMREVCDTSQVSSYAACVFVAGALYGTLATRTWYKFYFNPALRRRLNYGIYIIGDPGSGKSFAGDLYDLIMAPVKAEDQVGHDAINAYNKKASEANLVKGVKKEERPIYPDTKIRVHGSRTSNNVFIKDMVANKEIVDGEEMHLHLFTFDSELDSATSNSKGGQWIDKSIFELKAFHNEEDNQQYRNTDSVSGPFNVYWNFVYTGTPISLHRKVTERNFGNGLYGRLAVIPYMSDPFEMVPFDMDNEEQMADRSELTVWALKMDKVHGELPIRDLVRVSWEWTRDQMAIARHNNSLPDALLLRRIAYYGLNVSVPFILMRHYEEFTTRGSLTIDDHDKTLCTLVMDIHYFSQKYYFGRYANMYCDDSNNDNASSLASIKRQSRSSEIYSSLPQEFTLKDVEAQAGNSHYASVLVSRWKASKVISKKGTGQKAKMKKLSETL